MPEGGKAPRLLLVGFDATAFYTFHIDPAGQSRVGEGGTDKISTRRASKGRLGSLRHRPQDQRDERGNVGNRHVSGSTSKTSASATTITKTTREG